MIRKGKMRKQLAMLSVSALLMSSLTGGTTVSAGNSTSENSQGEIAFTSESTQSVNAETFDEREVSAESTSGYWHYSDGTLTYDTSSSGAIDVDDLWEYDDVVTKIVIESGPTTIGGDFEGFEGFTALTEVEYKTPVTIDDMCFIRSSLFSGCTSLKKVTIGASDGTGLEIDRSAFYNCTSLTDVSFGKGTWHFGRDSFGNCTSLETFKFPIDMHNVRGDSFRGCTSLKTLKLSDQNSYMRAAGNAIYEINDPYSRTSCYITPCLMFVPEGLIKDAGGDYTVVKGTKDIQYWAFVGDSSLKNLTVASTVESIQLEAFYDCTNLTTITLPKSLTRVGQYAFGVDSVGASSDSITSNVSVSVASENSRKENVSAQSEEPLYPMYGNDSQTVNSSITDIYYEGSEDDWKNIQYAEYSLNEGHLNNMSISSTTTLYDHLEEVGLPSNVIIHYNSTLTDTDYTLDDLLNHVEAKKFTSSDLSELSTLGVDFTVKYTTLATYNGRKHTRTTDKASGSTSNDIKVSVSFADASTGAEVDSFSIKKIKFKNNKNAAESTAKKAPYLTIELKSSSSLDTTKKQALKSLNKKLKNKNLTDTNFYFTIEPADISGFTSDNFKGLTIKKDKSGAYTAKFKILAMQYKYLGGGETKSNWIELKQCRKNNSSKKGDYTLEVNSSTSVTVTGHNNYTGSVVLTNS